MLVEVQETPYTTLEILDIINCSHRLLWLLVKTTSLLLNSITSVIQ